MSYLQTEYDYFVARGFTPAQASGIVGNLQQESGGNPESVQQGGPGRGIAQWSLGGRWQPRLMTGNPTVDLQNQLDFLMQELNTVPGYGLSALKASSTPTQAAAVFGTDFERYGIAGARVQDAQNIYNEVTSGKPIPGPGGANAILTSHLGPTAPGGSWDPLNWPGDIAGAAVSGTAALGGDVISAGVKSLVQSGLVLRGTLMVVGIIIAIIGLRQLFSGSQTAGQTVGAGAQDIKVTVQKAGAKAKEAGESTGEAAVAA